MVKSKSIYRTIALTLIAIFTTITLVLASNQISKTTQQTEIRGVWITNIDSDVLFSNSATTAAINRLAKLNFNTLYPTVWQGGYTLYPSQVAQQVFGKSLDPTPGLQGRDFLQEIITEAHQKGLTIIPWFEFGFMAPADSELAKLHPNWLTKRRDGTTIKMEGEYPRVWLNPFHPEVQQFILDLVMEIVTKYDIDGIQFDDHFGLPAEFGYDDFTVKLYEKELPGLSPSDNYQETFWVRWRADKINNFMERVSEEIKSIKPDCIISVSPNPFHFALPAYLQDWFTWEREELIDEIVLQVYRSDMKRFINELERTEVKLAKNNIHFAIGILTGLKNNSTPITIIEEQIEAVRKRNFAGVSFFFYESLWKWGKESENIRNEALEKIFQGKISRPHISSSKKEGKLLRS
ncbi:glycoside hydrolase family 10 protein [Okeania sp. SIO1I7]|uniref:glycoside hydrolase family 10 protein n=1 Tax=Okeania sp. SIO1I7 TaxID=2607772 RepID=UPI0013FAE294|nr:glycoside hydrolase family 10 protein [Okeania sp. SIO1I7]NET28429.1 family 10 glycosylhydrolase [Okeania sp. SIO1I7]